MAKRTLVTGGAGFIGVNLANRLLARGEEVVVLDDLSRPGGEENLRWLTEANTGRDRLDVVRGDVADFETVHAAMAGCHVVAHLAGQVAVTTSLAKPLDDFRANALGTLCVLEAARLSARDPIVVYASTNKVYGDLARHEVTERETRYEFARLPHGIDEHEPMDLQSPYACSKGCGDLYTLDYFRSYGLRTVVLRQSCIYGPRQMGHEGQGWVVWLMKQALTQNPIHIYGSGKQVRDLLYVDDLLDAFDAAQTSIDRAAGQAYNIGGGAHRTLSVWRELGPWLERRLGYRIPVEAGPFRLSDQRIFVSDVRKARRDLDWEPRTSLEDGLERTLAWVESWLAKQ